MFELYRQQSIRWDEIARRHVSEMSRLATDFVKQAMEYVVKDPVIRTHLHQIAESHLEDNIRKASEEMEKILKDEKRPVSTYNHYYTDNIQKARGDALRKKIRKALNDAVGQDWGGKMHISNTAYDLDRLMTTLQNRVTVDMDEQACSEALASLEAYYKVPLAISTRYRNQLTRAALGCYEDIC